MSHGNYRLSYIIANLLYTFRHRAPYENGLPNQMMESLNLGPYFYGTPRFLNNMF